jgi:uncharacterized delta-60 repeat protein
MRVRSLILATALLALLAAPAVAAPGDLDQSFDGDGLRIVDWGGSDSGHDVAVQPDGKIVVVGVGFLAPVDFGISRLNPDGSFDTGFDGDGSAFVALGGDEIAFGVAIQPDGKIVAAGQTSLETRGAIARLQPNGTRDSGFALNGALTLEYGGIDLARDVLIQPDGGIVTAGGRGTTDDMVVTRLTAGGTPDPSFNGGVSRALDFGGTELAAAVAQQADGKLVIAGSTTGAGQATVVARLNVNGSTDTSFDGDGRATLAGPPGSVAADMVIQPDGKIVVAGFVSEDFDGGGILRVTRLNPDGTPDGGFGASGVATIDFGGADSATAVALLANGKIVVLGNRDSQPAVARLQPGGTLDATFGDGGKVIVPGTIQSGQGLALQPNGRMVIAGSSSVPGDVVVARLEGDSPAAGGGPGGGPGAPGGPGGSGGSGGQTVPRCGGKRATIVGTNRSDRLKGTRRADVIVALGGNDRIAAGRGNDLICAGAGNDSIDGGTGNDRLYGQDGKDKLAGGSGKDTLSGGGGKDRLAGGSGRDSCSGDSGKDSAACEREKSV